MESGQCKMCVHVWTDIMESEPELYCWNPSLWTGIFPEYYIERILEIFQSEAF